MNNILSISDDEGSHSDNYSISNGTSSVEISSTINEYENELVNISAYHHLESKFNDDNNGQDFEWPESPPPLSSCSSSFDLTQAPRHIRRTLIIEDPF